MFPKPIQCVVTPGIGVLVVGCALVLRHIDTSGTERSPSSSQSRGVDCGAASLYLLCKATGKDGLDLSYLRELTKTTALGTNMFDLKEAAESIGFEAVGLIVPFKKLQEFVCKPKAYAILFLENGHFVAVLGSRRRGVLVVDPDVGPATVDEADLRGKSWEGAALLLSYGDKR